MECILLYFLAQVLCADGYDGFAADMWSCGVCMFGLLFSFFPVTEATPEDWRFSALVRAQLVGVPSVETIFSWYKRDLALSKVSALALDLLDGLLQTDPRGRASIVETSLHPWLYLAGKYAPGRCTVQTRLKSSHRGIDCHQFTKASTI